MLTNNRFISELKKNITPDKILTSEEERYVYAQDSSNIPDIKNIPDAVVFPETTEQVQKILKLAHKYKTPVICRGAGTNVVGACTVSHGGIILNFTRMNKILNISRENMTAVVQPGVILKDLQTAVEKIGLFYPPDPSNMAVSTIGGSIAQSSGGAKTFKYGSTKDYILDLTVVDASGEIIKTGSGTIKNAAGYNLNSLFAGSEGTLGIITEATLKLIPKPEAKKVFMAYFDSVTEAVKTVNAVIEQRIFPATIDFMDKNALQTVEKFYPAGLLTSKEAALIIEIDGFKVSMPYQEKIITDILKSCNASDIKASHNDEEYEKIWTARRSSMGACAKLKPNVTTDDIIVPRKNLAAMVTGIQHICEKYNLTTCLVGHVGDGSIHPQIPIDYNDKTEYQNYKLAKTEIYKLTADLGGTISGEHGIGVLKRDYLSMTVNPNAIEYMRKIKKAFDPDNILNPYKIF